MAPQPTGRRGGGRRSGRHHDRSRGVLVGTAVGDGLGLPFEGHAGTVPLARITEVERDLVSLRSSDDTAMTIALAESLLAVDDLDEDHLAAAFAERWRRDPDRGYSAGTASVLQRIAAGADWRTATAERDREEASVGDGAAMRVAPVALLADGDVGAAAALARRSARVTHTSPVAVEGAALQAAAVAAALHLHVRPGAALDATAFLARTRSAVTEPLLHRQLDVVAELVAGHAGPADVAAAVGTGVSAAEAVPAALCSFLLHPHSFRGVVRTAISLGGDTDTIAAMAGAVSGAHLGASSIPQSWVVRAEGASELDHLGVRLARRRVLLRRR